jgi:hypothetical protein
LARQSARCWTVSAVLVLSAATHAGADSSGAKCADLFAPRLRVRLSLEAGGLPVTGRDIPEIVSSIWEPEGLAFEWLSRPDEQDVKSVDLWVLVRPEPPSGRDKNMLGSILFLAGRPTNVIRVSLEAVVRWVRQQVLGDSSPSGALSGLAFAGSNPLVERTLGFVVAHEIGHFVLASREHSRDGVMKASYDSKIPFDPSRSPPGLDSHSRELLRDRLEQHASCGQVARSADDRVRR